MRKFLLFSITSVSLKASLTAQQYYPMLDSVNNIWNYSGNIFPVVQNNPGESLMPNCNYPLWFGGFMWEEGTIGDTVLNAKTYKIVRFGDAFGGCIAGYLREDTTTRKIYFQDVNNTPEVLLYDFSMQVGNTIAINFYNTGGYFSTGNYTLDSIEPVLIKAGVRRAFYLSSPNNPPNRPLIWIESVGNRADILYTYSANMPSMGWFSMYCQGFPYDNFSIMTCFSHNQIVFFDSCAHQTALAEPCLGYIDTCHYGNICGSAEEISSVSSFAVFPNPAASNVSIEMNVLLSDEFEIYIWDITGKRAKKKIGLGQLPQGEFSQKINVSHLADGFYLVECRTKDNSLYRKLVVKH